jgi:hypothetical protein
LSKLAGKKMSFEGTKIEAAILYPVYLGQCLVKGEIIGKHNLNYLSANDRLKIDLEIQKSVTLEKKNAKGQKIVTSDFKPIIRISTSRCEVGSI